MKNPIPLLGTQTALPTFLDSQGRENRNCGPEGLERDYSTGAVNHKAAGADERKTKVRAMNNSSLTSADTSTHLKVVVVSLIAGILVIGVGIAASPTVNQSGAATRMEATGPVIRAGKPMAVTAGETATIR